MDMSEDLPAVVHQCPRDLSADALAGPRDDCGSLRSHCEERSDEAIHSAQGWIASPRSQ
jgi:hypothetical protein